jgi:hypothetical protein
MANESSKPQLPYMGYGVFKGAINALAESTIPSGPLDRHVLDKVSGADHGALMSGLSFLGYVDKGRKATSEYKELILASKEDNQSKYQALLFEALSVAYADIVGDVNIQTGTLTELEKAFKAYGVPQGQMLTKTIRFYIKALKDCGVSVSQHITKPRPRTTRTASKKIGKDGAGGETPPPQTPHINAQTPVPKGFERMPVPGLPDAFVQFPLNLTEAHCDLFDSVVRVLRTFAKGRTGGKENVA